MRILNIKKSPCPTLWYVTIPIRYEAETFDFLDGMEQVSNVYPIKQTTEVTFSVYLSARCEKKDLIDVENAIKGWEEVLKKRQ